jgi:hypothetical protein
VGKFVGLWLGDLDGCDVVGRWVSNGRQNSGVVISSNMVGSNV